MKLSFLRFGFLILLLTAICSAAAAAQNNSVKTTGDYDCEQQPLGVFRERTNASMELSGVFYDRFHFIKESDKQDKRWALDALDEVDPAYKFYIPRNPSNSGKKCGAVINVIGALVSPTGKLFDFKEATYDIPSRRLKFTTIERDGIKYEVEIEFYDAPKNVNRMYEQGTAKLKASGKTLGIVSKEFQITSWGFE